MRFSPFVEYDSALTNELRIVVIHSRSVYSQRKLADLGYIPECKSKNPIGLDEVIIASRENVASGVRQRHSRESYTGTFDT